MHAAGLRTWVDEVANVHGRADASDATAPALVMGSHYDTVKDAGRFDGALGILGAIAAVKTTLLQVGPQFCFTLLRPFAACQQHVCQH